MPDQTQQSSELLAVLEHQKANAAAQSTVDQLNQAIEVQHAKAELLRNQAVEVTALQTEREDLLADIATGQDKTASLQALEARLEEKKKDLTEQGTQAAIEQTVAGLTRKLDRAQGELTQVQAKRPALLRNLLHAQAEALGRDYVAAAFELKDLHQRLSGLSSMLIDGGMVLPLVRGGLEIPAANLDSVKPHADYINPNMLVTRDFDRRHLVGVIDREKAAFRDLGVEIT